MLLIFWSLLGLALVHSSLANEVNEVSSEQIIVQVAAVPESEKIDNNRQIQNPKNLIQKSKIQTKASDPECTMTGGDITLIDKIINCENLTLDGNNISIQNSTFTVSGLINITASSSLIMINNTFPNLTGLENDVYLSGNDITLITYELITWYYFEINFINMFQLCSDKIASVYDNLIISNHKPLEIISCDGLIDETLTKTSIEARDILELGGIISDIVDNNFTIDITAGNFSTYGNLDILDLRLTIQTSQFNISTVDPFILNANELSIQDSFNYNFQNNEFEFNVGTTAEFDYITYNVPFGSLSGDIIVLEDILTSQIISNPPQEYSIIIKDQSSITNYGYIDTIQIVENSNIEIRGFNNGSDSYHGIEQINSGLNVTYSMRPDYIGYDIFDDINEGLIIHDFQLNNSELFYHIGIDGNEYSRIILNNFTENAVNSNVVLNLTDIQNVNHSNVYYVFISTNVQFFNQITFVNENYNELKENFVINTVVNGNVENFRFNRQIYKGVNAVALTPTAFQGSSSQTSSATPTPISPTPTTTKSIVSTFTASSSVPPATNTPTPTSSPFSTSPTPTRSVSPTETTTPTESGTNGASLSGTPTASISLEIEPATISTTPTQSPTTSISSTENTISSSSSPIIIINSLSGSVSPSLSNTNNILNSNNMAAPLPISSVPNIIVTKTPQLGQTQIISQSKSKSNGNLPVNDNLNCPNCNTGTTQTVLSQNNNNQQVIVSLTDTNGNSIGSISLPNSNLNIQQNLQVNFVSNIPTQQVRSENGNEDIRSAITDITITDEFGNEITKFRDPITICLEAPKDDKVNFIFSFSCFFNSNFFFSFLG